MAYLRRSLAGITSWPLVVTVETSVFIVPRFGADAIGKVYLHGESKSNVGLSYIVESRPKTKANAPV